MAVRVLTRFVVLFTTMVATIVKIASRGGAYS